MKKTEPYGSAFATATVHHASTVPPADCSPAFSRLIFFATIFGFSPFYPCCNHLSLDCMVFHLVCKAT